MLKDPSSMYENKRSNKLLKVKKFEDAEAIVIDY
jgi:ATP-dependent DNA ligase